MDIKKISATALALALAASLSGGALAAQEGLSIRPISAPLEGEEAPVIMPISVTLTEDETEGPQMPEVDVAAPGGGYSTVITVNGKEVETYSFDRSVPGWGSVKVEWAMTYLHTVPQGYVPMRAVAQADGGSVYWSQEENQSTFRLWESSICAHYDDMSVTVDDEKVEGATVLLMDGVTYLPLSVLDGLEGFTITAASADGVEKYEIVTPNGAPLMKLANELKEISGVGMGMRNTPEQMEQYYGESLGFQAEMVTEGVFFTSINTRPDFLGLGRVAPGQLEALEEVMEAYRQQQENTFSWYLSYNLPKVENAKFVTEGDWFLFLIAENVDEAVEAFRAAVQEME